MARTAILYIAERCNQSCVFCLEEDGQWTEFVDPSTLEVNAHVERLYQRGARHITFMGGETFFRKDLGRILSHAKKTGYSRLGVTTNGTVLSKKGFLADLRAHGLDFIEISIHAHTPELAEAIAGTPFTFERQAQALTEIQELGDVHTIVNVVVCRENRGHLVDVARYVCEGFPRIPKRFKFKFVSLQGLASDRAGCGDHPLSYSDVDAVAAGDYLAEKGVPYWFYNFPLCRLGRHAAHAHEVGTLAVDETYFDLDHRSTDGYYDSGGQLEGRVWPSASCGPCAVRALCPGLEATYQRVHGAGELSPRRDDALSLLVEGFASRGEPAGDASARLAELERQPRPTRFLRPRAEGALRFHNSGEPEPLDILIEARVEGRRAYGLTARFALSYRQWDGEEATSRPRVKELLAAAMKALQVADSEGASLDGARAAVGRSAASGWTLEAGTAGAALKRKGALPVLSAGPR